MTKNWFVVKTQPRRETQARSVLEQRGVEVYLPEIPITRRRNDPTPPRAPYFPGYLFARLAIATPDWIMARSAPGVAYFLGTASKPSPLPDELVDEIRARIEERQRLGWHPPYRTGDRVRITDGAFAGLEAIFDRKLSSRGRVRVFLQLLHQIVPVDVDVACLARPR